MSWTHIINYFKCWHPLPCSLSDNEKMKCLRRAENTVTSCGNCRKRYPFNVSQKERDSWFTNLLTKGNSSEIKVTIYFCSNFVHWIFIIWELQFWNKKGGAHAHWGTVRHWKCPIWALFNAYYKNAFTVIVKSLWAQTHEDTQ